MENRICKQCGERKPLSNYRSYYGGRKGRYRICNTCEKINSRAKYLENKPNKDKEQIEELNKIHSLWELQRKLGYCPPTKKDKESIVDSIDEALKKYNNEYLELLNHTTISLDEVPKEITQWLTVALDQEPDYYLDEIYEKLASKYRPVKYIDKDTNTPVYDDTYREALQQVLARFDEYEDNYYD